MSESWATGGQTGIHQYTPILESPISSMGALQCSQCASIFLTHTSTFTWHTGEWSLVWSLYVEQIIEQGRMAAPSRKHCLPGYVLKDLIRLISTSGVHTISPYRQCWAMR